VLRKLVVAVIVAMVVAVVTGSFSAQARLRCRRVTVTIADTPYFAHPICTDLPDPLADTAGSGDIQVRVPLPISL
jgi:hypothetical protein